MDLDKETVQVVAIGAGTVVAVAALVFDGELGNAIGTGILSFGGMIVGYLFGKGTCPRGEVTINAEEVQVDGDS